jgi:alkanesulfonate monooxygenase SsuD/methylene tetrahydromethanopterin reductase-like flavin-dependent oxidoreductase (luciferase family)
MKFGVTVVPRASDWRLFVDLETMGYDCAWAAESQMLYSDAYAVLALAAANTSRIRLGMGVSVAGVRLAPVTAHSIATINKLAAGRVFLGIGTGHTAMRVMGKDPMKAGSSGSMNEITLLPATAEARQTLRDFAEKVIARY